MELSRFVHGLPGSGHDLSALAPATPDLSAMELGRQRAAEDFPRLWQSIDRTRNWLLAQQKPDGHWVGELEGDSILESEYILLLAHLGRHDEPQAAKTARYVAQRQLPRGGWAIYPGGKVDVSASVKAYFALKLAGHHPCAPHMQRACSAIMSHGGADSVNSFTRFYLALLGQIPYRECPAVPPEVMLLPRWFPVHLNSVSAWSRTILVPLSIMSALQPVTRLSPELGISELFVRPPEQWPPLLCPGLKGGTGPLSWDRFFRMVDRFCKWCQRRRILPARRRALAAAERWIVARFAGSEGLGAIFPPMIWSVVALKALGYSDDSPQLRYCLAQLGRLAIDDGETLRLEPCKSPVWDTAIVLRSLAAAGAGANHPAVERGVNWLLDRQIRRPGDWSETVSAEPGGWCFEYANDFYPDIDDTAMVLMALGGQFNSSTGESMVRGSNPGDGFSQRKVRPLDREASEAKSALLARTTQAIDRGQRWMLAFQNRDGGWGAFDRDNDRQFLCYVPFADHNAMIDPSTPDLAARVLEALACLGRRAGDPVVDRAIAYLRRTQEVDGSWFGRWGVNHIYGTWQVLTGLCDVGLPASDSAVAAGIVWLIAHQQETGAWGESPDSYADPSLCGKGPATASQTAWALLGLIAAGQADHQATVRGVAWLLDRQRPDGTWEESEFTGTGFPQVFYLRYHLYRVYFPLLALGRYAGAMADRRAAPAQTHL